MVTIAIIDLSRSAPTWHLRDAFSLVVKFAFAALGKRAGNELGQASLLRAVKYHG